MSDGRDWTAPIIVVGPGRSGSTLLARLLHAHPDVTSAGETYFFLQKLWRSICDLDPSYGAIAQVTEAEKARRFALVGRFFCRLVCSPDTQHTRWSFKEIWAGSDSFNYNWDVYKMTFPKALYIQSTRHPIGYAKSYLGRLDPSFYSDANTLYTLAQWVQMMRHNMALAQTERYFRYRLEDLVAKPEQTFQQICSFLGLRSDPICLEAMKYKHDEKQREVEISPSVLDEVEGLRPLMEELGYS